MKIYQDTDGLSFCLDSVLLSDFVDILKSTRKVLDIGAGTGAISILLSKKTSAQIDAIEIQKQLADLFIKSVEYNNLNNQVNVINEDVKEYAKNINNYYDIIVSNPPYYNAGKENTSKLKNVARHEIHLNLDDIISVVKKMLKNGGCFYMVYDTKRFYEVINKLNNSNLIPKVIRFVHPNSKKESSMFLIKCIKNGKSGLKIEKPFVLYDENNNINSEYQSLLSTKE